MILLTAPRSISATIFATSIVKRDLISEKLIDLIIFKNAQD